MVDLSSHINDTNNSNRSESDTEGRGDEKMGGVSNVVLRGILPD